MSKTFQGPRRDVENSREPRDVHAPHADSANGPKGTARHSNLQAHGPWSWKELCTVWDHPDWTAKEIATDLLPHRSPDAVRRIRERYGRYRVGRVPICAKCGQRPVWVESVHARRLGLCESCYLEEEELRLKSSKRNVALRQRRMNARRRGEEE